MSNNPYAKRLNKGRPRGATADEEDLYEFNTSHTAGAHELIAATIGNKGMAGQTLANNNAAAADMNAFGQDYSGGMMASQMRVPTAMGGGDGPRPMTSVKGAGYSSSRNAQAAAAPFDPLQQGASSGPAPPLQQKTQDSPEHQAREMEKNVNKLIEESAAANKRGEHSVALDKAKEAAKKERLLVRHREKHNLLDSMNYELTYSVAFALANAYEKNEMHSEALNAYAMIIKNQKAQQQNGGNGGAPSASPQTGRIRVNMGNIYYKLKKYTAAIKMYRMAMDQIGNTSRDMRFKIMRNIGNAFVRLGQFQDAIHSYEAIMDASASNNNPNHHDNTHLLTQHADAQTGFNLILCYYALGDREKMKKGFTQLLQVPEFEDNENEEEEELLQQEEIAALTGQKHVDSDGNSTSASSTKPGVPNATQMAAISQLYGEEIKNEKAERRKITHKYLFMAARLIAPVIISNSNTSKRDSKKGGNNNNNQSLLSSSAAERDADLSSGYDWIIDQLKQPKPSQVNNNSNTLKSGFPQIAMELEICKGIAFLKRRQIAAAIEVFKGFEKKDHSKNYIDQASTNLSFLYFLERDLKNAEKYAELAVKSDRYNAKALVNKANYLYMKGELENAKELYLEAIGVEADCVEAIYNLGLTNKRLGLLTDALQAFKKLHRIIPKDPQVIWHIANLLELTGYTQDAIHWFNTLHSAIPSDPKVLARLGTLYTKEDDDASAFHNFSDSYAVYPVQMEVLSWLGVWYVKSEAYEDAIQYFERASEIEPNEIKWRLMIASCYRRMNNLSQALDLYKKIHKIDPDNIECLRYLVNMTKDNMGAEKDHEEYLRLLRRAENAQIQRQQEQQGGGYLKSDLREEQEQQLLQVPNGGGAAAPSVSPNDSPRASRQQQQYYNQQQAHHAQAAAQQARAPGLADTFQAHLTPTKQGPTLNSGKNGDDEWGDGGLGDDLLP